VVVGKYTDLYNYANGTQAVSTIVQAYYP
jgi:hypothetical protein